MHPHPRVFDDVVSAAYEAGTGIVPAKESASTGCARCRRATAATTPVGDVVSRRFTGYESWLNPQGRGLCEVCVWAYRHPPLRREAHVIIRRPATLRTAPPAELRSVLSAPLTPDTAVTVPLTPGRKHLLPTARWGHVTADNIHLTWGTGDADRLGAMCALRAAGFSENELHRPAPSYATLRDLPHEHWPGIFEQWEQLMPWRAAPAWWEVGVRASRSG